MATDKCIGFTGLCTIVKIYIRYCINASMTTDKYIGFTGL